MQWAVSEQPALEAPPCPLDLAGVPGCPTSRGMERTWGCPALGLWCEGSAGVCESLAKPVAVRAAVACACALSDLGLWPGCGGPSPPL